MNSSDKNAAASTDQFNVLGDREHALHAPYMFVGSTTLESITDIFDGTLQTKQLVPALLKITNELIDNAFDEFIRTNGEFGNKIDITVDDASITVRDNGRGIPVEKIDSGDDDHVDEWRPALAWTRARAGTNFNVEQRMTAGAHGYGSYLTNIFSDYFCGETFDGQNKFKLECIDNAKTIKTKNVTKKSSGKTYTQVTFKPSLSLFEGISDTITQAHIDAIRDRLIYIAACFPAIRFRLNGDMIQYKTLKSFAQRFAETTVTYSDDQNIIVLANSGDAEEFQILSYVNGLHIKNGGSHIDYIMDSIIECLRPKVKRKLKIDVKPNQIKQHLLLVSMVRNMPNLKFDSQTKERISNTKSDIQQHVGDINFDRIAQNIMNTPELIDPITEAALIKKEQRERMEMARAQKKNKRQKVIKHIEATSKNPEEKTLFIAEGESAMNPLLSLRRSSKYIGGYPLRGKPLNTRTSSKKDVLANPEIADIMSILGLEFDKSIRTPEYGRIALLTDADTDGYAIVCLIINFLSHWPELFENGHVYRAITPLFIATRGNDVRYFYSFDEYRNADIDKNKWTIEYMKGLGSLPEYVYDDVINNPKLETIVLDDESMLEMAFSKDSGPRKEWLQVEASD